MNLFVQKYGGTSLGTPEKILAVARNIADRKKQGHELVIVVSAMGSTTDELLNLAAKVSRHPSPRELDMLLTTGERISISLLSMALQDLSIQAVSYTGSQSGILTDNRHGRARIKRILGDRIRHSLKEHKVVIVAGFQGMSEEEKEITTLGRGGSDTTAVALAAALSCSTCEIYTDVPGVYTADPTRFPNAICLPEVSYPVMTAFALAGAGVLHHRCVELAARAGIKIAVKEAHPKDQVERGSMIMNKISKNIKDLEGPVILGIVGNADRVLLKMELARDSVAGSFFDKARIEGWHVVHPLILQSQVWMYVERAQEETMKAHLEILIRDGFLKDYEFFENLAPLTVVGECLPEDGSLLQQVTEVLAVEYVRSILTTTTSHSMTFAIPINSLDDAVKVIHQKFIES